MPDVQSGICPARVGPQDGLVLKFQEFCHEMETTQDFLSFTVEDKDPNVLWAVNTKCQMIRWANILLKTPSRWRLCFIEHKQVTD